MSQYYEARLTYVHKANRVFCFIFILPWRRGIVVVASAYRTEDSEFESLQGVRFKVYIHCSVVVKTLYALSLCELEKN
jgi:hypothetical protein